MTFALALFLVAAEPEPLDRAVAAGSAALGAAAGGVVGSSAAIAIGAGLSGFNSDAGAVPMIALPPALAAAGAGAGGAVSGGSSAGWAAGVAGMLGGGIATLGIALVVLDGRTQLDSASSFVLTVGAPAGAAALFAGTAAAFFAQAPPGAAAAGE